MTVEDFIRLSIIALVLVVVLIGISTNIDKSIDGFNGGYPLTEKTCLDCNSMNTQECVDCDNCGVCIDGTGNVTCMPGDVNGPYFNNMCKYWINKEVPNFYGSVSPNKLVISRPWSYFYPHYDWRHTNKRGQKAFMTNIN